MISLTELLAKVEAATGPDRELDAAIACAFERDWFPTPEFGSGTLRRRDYSLCEADCLTSYLDATLALAERALPGLYMWRIDFDDEPTSYPYEAHVYAKDCEGKTSGRFAALAMIAAILKALIAKDAAQ